MTDADRMSRMRERRKESGIKELRFWVREKDIEKAKQVTTSFQKLALFDEEKDNVKSLEKELKEKLKEFQTWEKYLKEKYDFNLEPSTEKQRKYALRLASVCEEEVPIAILKHKGLLGSWIHNILKKN